MERPFLAPGSWGAGAKMATTQVHLVNEPYPCTFLCFYGEDADRLFTINHGVTQACCGHPTHDPHVTHSTRVVGKRNWRGSYYSEPPPLTRPRTVLGLSQ